MQAEVEKRARAAEESGNLKQAIDLWLSALEEHPDDKQALAELGRLYFKAKLFQKASQFLARALERDHGDLNLRFLLANSFTQLGRFEEAEREFRIILEAEPDQVAARVELARMYLRQHQVEPAIGILQEALSIKPTDVQVHWQLAQIYRTLGDLEQSDHHLRQILDIRSESPLAQQARKILEESYAEARGIPPGAVQTLRAENLVKFYGKRQVVRQVSIAVRQGEIVGLLGPNGAGKTTTFYMIVGMIRPNSGRIFINDRDITKMPMYRRARLGIGYLSQEPSIFRKLTVEDNIYAILQMMKISEAERRNRLEELLNEFGLQHIRKNKGYNLSGGERRRVEIARALVLRPKFLLLDEPFAGIDPIAVEDIQNIVHRLRQKGIGILITDHNVHETLEITDRAYLLYDGRVLKSGTAEFLANDPEARTLYLGDKFRLDR